MKHLLFLLICTVTLLSCNTDDDICISGEATPRLEMKFKTADNKLLQLDTLFVDVQYREGIRNVVYTAKADSILLPLRVDDNAFTDIYIRRRKAGPQSKVRINYTTQSEYVSPACGIKRTYRDVTYSLEKADPVTKVEPIQTEIINEEPTHLYLIF